MKLIREEVENVEVITEGKGSAKKMYIEGTFLQGDIKNRNGRMYPIATLAKEVGRYNEAYTLSLIHISEPTRRRGISYAVFCLKKKKNWKNGRC